MVILSRKTRYAFHGVAYIAAFSRGKPVSFEDILAYLRVYSRELSLSPGYIAKIFQTLSKAGIIRATSGPRGGYTLSRAPRALPLIELVEALEGPLISGCCLNAGTSCPMESRCGVSDTLRDAETSFHRYLEKQTVGALVSRMAFPDLKGAAGRSKGPRKPGARKALRRG